jgi:long-chain fatty acid transport protein
MHRPINSLPNLRAAALMLAVAGALPSTSHAGGIALYEIGSPDVGTASAGYAARAQEPSTVFTNPAGLTLLPGTQAMLGIQPLIGQVTFSVDETTNTGGNGGNALGIIPAGGMFLSHQIDDRWSVGFGVFSYFGLTEKYDDDWAGRYYVQNASLVGLSLMPSVAFKVNDQLSVGAGLNAMMASFSTEVAIHNFDPSYSDGQLKLEDSDWGFGANLGVLYKFNKGTRVGVTYLSPVDLTFNADTKFYNLGPGLSGLLERRDLQSVQMDITVPQMIMASIYHEIDDQWAIMGNVGWQDWSEFGKVDISVDSANPKSLTTSLDYQDTWHGAVGVQYKPVPKWKFSTGLAYDSSMVKDSDRTVTLPTGETWRVGLGAQYDLSKAVTLGLAYELVYMGDMSVDQVSGPMRGTIHGTYNDAMIHVVAFTLNWKM